MTDTLLATLAQFGPAGLIAALWLIERRHSAKREQQLDEAHRELLSKQTQVDSLIVVVRDNTQSMTTLEQTQRRLIGLLDRIWRLRSRSVS